MDCQARGVAHEVKRIALLSGIKTDPLIAPFAWKTPESAWHLTLRGVIGLLASIGHYLLIKAYDHAGATLLAPYTYTAMVWAMLLGFAVFGNFPDAWSLGGMAVIVVSGMFLASRQRLTVRRA